MAVVRIKRNKMPRTCQSVWLTMVPWWALVPPFQASLPGNTMLWKENASRTEVLKLELAPESPRGLMKIPVAGPHPQSFWFRQDRLGLKNSHSEEISSYAGDAEAAGRGGEGTVGTHWEPRTGPGDQQPLVQILFGHSVVMCIWTSHFSSLGHDFLALHRFETDT